MHVEYYSGDGFWAKTRLIPRSAGKKFVEPVLLCDHAAEQAVIDRQQLAACAEALGLLAGNGAGTAPRPKPSGAPCSGWPPTR